MEITLQVLCKSVKSFQNVDVGHYAEEEDC